MDPNRTELKKQSQFVKGKKSESGIQRPEGTGKKEERRT
jgi:hypothetical protein